MFSLNSLNSLTKKLKIKEEDYRVGTQDLPRNRQRLYHSATEPQATEQMLTLNHSHTVVFRNCNRSSELNQKEAES